MQKNTKFEVMAPARLLGNHDGSHKSRCRFCIFWCGAAQHESQADQQFLFVDDLPEVAKLVVKMA